MQGMTKKTLAVFKKHALDYPVLLVLIMSIVVACTFFDLYRPVYLKKLVDMMSSGQKDLDMGKYLIRLWVGLGIIRYVLWRSVGFSNNNFQPKIISNLMNHCYEHVIYHSRSFFTNNFSGSIQARLRKFSYAFETVADQVCFDLGRSLLLLLVLQIIMLTQYPIVGLMMLGFNISFFTFTYKYTNFKWKYDVALSEQDTLVTAHLADTLSNHPNINLFAAHKREIKAFRVITEKLNQLRKKAWHFSLLSEVVQGILLIILEWVVIDYTLNQWYTGSYSVGDLTFVQAYILRIFENTWHMGRNIRKVYEQLANSEEMSQMLSTDHEVIDIPDAKDLVVTAGKINFANVTFGYEGATPVFNNFNLGIKGAQKIALVGDSGGGKSTFVKLLLREVDINSGQIMIDGQDISQVTQDSLHRSVTSVPQDPSLFHRSLKDNIKYANPNATDEEMIAAAKASHCHDFISELPLGYETFVGEKGIKLSGGQRQRVAIARAILADSPIVVFDEATSSLDSESESYIQDALQTLMRGKTTIVIAHRLSTIKEMDWIIVVESGKIVEQGTHSMLLGNGGKYSRHWNIQSGGFVLNAAA